MYRLLIVDDEQMIVDWLYRLFSGLQHLELDIYKASSGDDAVELLNTMKMDIVLTDIRMPGMSGLQLLENLKARWSQCRVIFLTGYNEFDYVYTAIKYEGVQYLLKTEDDGEIIKAVENAVQDIEQSFRNSELEDLARQKIREAMPLLQREYLSELLSCEETSAAVNRQQLEELGIPLTAEQPVMLLLGRIDNLSKKLTRLEKTTLVYTIRETAQQYLLKEFTSVQILQGDIYPVWFIQPRLAAGETWDTAWKRTSLFIAETLDTVQRVCLDNLDVVLSLAVKGEPCRWAEIPEKLFELKQWISSSPGFDTGILLTDRNEGGSRPGEEKPAKHGKRLSEPVGGRTGALQNYLEMGRAKDFYDLFHEMTKELKEVKSMYSFDAMETYYSLALLFLSAINRANLVEKLAFQTGLYKLTRIEEFDTWREAVQYLENLAGEMFQVQNADRDQKGRDTVGRVREYIVRHLAEDISLVKLSEHVYFNPSYLSRLFKQETGMNITDYIHSVRMNKARELLAANDLKVHEIASLLGYESPAYFAKFLKKATGMTPQEYRDAAIKSKE